MKNLILVTSLSVLVFLSGCLTRESTLKNLICKRTESFEQSKRAFFTEVSFIIDTKDFNKNQPIALVEMTKRTVNGKPLTDSTVPIGKTFEMPYKLTPITLNLTFNLYYNTSFNEWHKETIIIDREDLTFKNGKCSIKDINQNKYAI